jgi:prophage maintenance system killer protein
VLSTFGLEVEAEQQELEDFAVSIAVGEMKTKNIALWFENHSCKR